MKLHIYICICLFFLISIYYQVPSESQSQFGNADMRVETYHEYNIYFHPAGQEHINSTQDSLQLYSSPLSNQGINISDRQSNQLINSENQSNSTTSQVPYLNTPEQDDNMGDIHNHSKGEEENEDILEILNITSSISPTNSTLPSSCIPSRKPYIFH